MAYSEYSGLLLPRYGNIPQGRRPNGIFIPRYSIGVWHVQKLFYYYNKNINIVSLIILQLLLMVTLQLSKFNWAHESM